MQFLNCVSAFCSFTTIPQILHTVVLEGHWLSCPCNDFYVCHVLTLAPTTMTRSTTLALLTATLISASVFSAPITHALKISVVYNSNLSTQQPTALLMSFSSNGTDALDAFDIGDQNSVGPMGTMVYPFTMTSDNTIVTNEDARPVLEGYTRIAFGFATKFPVTIKLLASLLSNSLDTTNRPAYAWLEQISTGNIYPIVGDTLELTLPANLAFASDFYLHTGPEILKTTANATCFNSNNGKISVINPNVTNWNLSIYKNNLLVNSTAVNQQDTTIANLSAGNYTVISSVNSVNVDSAFVLVKSPPQIIPAFTIDNYHPTTDDVVNFTNISAGGITYNWSFGDGNTDTQNNTAHQYNNAGNYEVILTAINNSGCQETTLDSVFVTAPSFSIHQGPNIHPNFDNSSVDNGEFNHTSKFDPAIINDQSNERIMIIQNETVEMTVRILDMSGRFISSVTSSNLTIEIALPQTGIYLVQLISKNGEMKSKTIFIN